MTPFTPAPRLGEPIDPAWRTWGPYLSDRQWGTVREDYSEFGTAWDFFTHDQARSRTYRWGEDGLLGISDNTQRLCFAIALWNGNDPILKERLFGLTGTEGNHGEDVKEYSWYLDATPSHSYLRAAYAYPHAAFPYADLVAENRRRSRSAPEYELLDTGVFAEDRYFDVQVEYAKVSPEDILIRIQATNRGADAATLHLLPTLWFRNTWSWGRDDRRPDLCDASDDRVGTCIQATHHALGDYWLACQGEPDLLFTENESNARRLWGNASTPPFAKDAINDVVVHGLQDAVNPARRGTKVAAHYVREIPSLGTTTVVLRLSRDRLADPFADAPVVFADRIAEADAFFGTLAGSALMEEAHIQRQAIAGLIWTKQYYNYDVAQWLDGDPAGPPPPDARKHGRNHPWRHHNAGDIISMPDGWEYPWYAAWDLAFHTLPLSLVDPEFAKGQLLLLLREWYMHPNGQLPAYEWAFGDVNPPVHIIAARAIYEDEVRRTGRGDREFLARVFHKLLLNVTWWINQKDTRGNNLFEGGFLGLDNISVIDRSSGVPPEYTLEQADGTAWMATYCLTMTWAALELSREDPAYQDLATKFLEHYLAIGGAMNGLEQEGAGLWDEEDGFYYDFAHRDDGFRTALRLRSLVGLLPIIPSVAIDEDLDAALRANAPDFTASLRWFADHHPELASLFALRPRSGAGAVRVLTVVPEDRLRRILRWMLDPSVFLSDFGIRSLSQEYRDHPFELRTPNGLLTVSYEPAESTSGMFGGNSNWRGPIWFPINILLVNALRTLHTCYGNDFLVEYPTGSGTRMPLDHIADDLSRRLIGIFARNDAGRRPVFGGTEKMQQDQQWRDRVLFYEYFHGDNGAGIGASHQTGWTAVVANLIERSAVGRAGQRGASEDDA